MPVDDIDLKRPDDSSTGNSAPFSSRSGSLLRHATRISRSSNVSLPVHQLHQPGRVLRGARGGPQADPRGWLDTERARQHRVPAKLLRLISEQAHDLVEEQYRVFNDELLPELQDKGISFLRRSDWTERRDLARALCERGALPVLSPLALDPAHPFPRVLNKSLQLHRRSEGRGRLRPQRQHAVVQAPRPLPRLIRLPGGGCGGGPNDFVFLSSVIHAHVDELFPGMESHRLHQFRVTRNSDLFVDEEEVDDLLRALEGELATRHYGDEVRLEVADNCPDDVASYLLNELRPDRAGPVPGERPGESASSAGGPGPGGCAGPQVPELHPGAAGTSAAGSGHVRGHRQARHAAAPPLRVLRAGGGLRAPGAPSIRRCSPSSRRCTAPAPIR